MKAELERSTVFGSAISSEQFSISYIPYPAYLSVAGAEVIYIFGKSLSANIKSNLD